MQPEYRYANYLSAVKCVSTTSRRLVSRFRTGCHTLQVDTYRWAKDVDVSRGCLVCKSLGCVDLRRTSSTLSLTFQHTVILEPSMWAFFSIVALLQTACRVVSPMHVVTFLVSVLHVGKSPVYMNSLNGMQTYYDSGRLRRRPFSLQTRRRTGSQFRLLRLAHDAAVDLRTGLAGQSLPTKGAPIGHLSHRCQCDHRLDVSRPSSRLLTKSIGGLERRILTSRRNAALAFF